MRIASKNIQRHAYQLTINNPLDYGFNHDEIKGIFVLEFPTLKYFCMADEIGAEGTPHTHIYVTFSSRVRFSTIKKHFPEAHIEPAKGSVQSNIEYIKKSGKWKDSDKADTRIEGTFEEWGTPPTQKGRNMDMQELYDLINEGYSNADIIALNNDYILNIEKLDKVRTILLTEKYKGLRRLNLKVIYISGATGTGKTRGVLDTHGDANVYRVSDYLHPFDNYNCEPVLVFDEFRNGIKIGDMLNYCDIYPIQLPSRYANKFACYETVYVISNWSLESQYLEVQSRDIESWEAFLRRFCEVRTYAEDGTITIYHSVKEYLNRNQKFHPLTKDEEENNPFPEDKEDIPSEDSYTQSELKEEEGGLIYD